MDSKQHLNNELNNIFDELNKLSDSLIHDSGGVTQFIIALYDINSVKESSVKDKIVEYKNSMNKILKKIEDEHGRIFLNNIQEKFTKLGLKKTEEHFLDETLPDKVLAKKNLKILIRNIKNKSEFVKTPLGNFMLIRVRGIYEGIKLIA